MCLPGDVFFVRLNKIVKPVPFKNKKSVAIVQQYIIVPELRKRRPPNSSVSQQGTCHNILEKVQIKLGATVCHMEANEYNQPL